TGHVTVVGGHTTGDHLHFLNGALGQPRTGTGRHFHPVDIVIGVLRTRTADTDAATRTGIGGTGHSGGDGCRATTGHLGDVLTRDGTPGSATVTIDQGHSVLHHLEFLQLDTLIELKIEEGDAVGVHHHTGTLVRLVTHEGHHHVICTRFDRLDVVHPVEVRGITGDLLAGPLDHHVHERQRFTGLAISDLAPELAGTRLGVHSHHQRKQGDRGE